MYGMFMYCYGDPRCVCVCSDKDSDENIHMMGCYNYQT